MVTETREKTKTGLKVKFCDRTLWDRYLVKLGIISTIISFISFFVTAGDLCISVWWIVGLFIFVIIGTFLLMWCKANSKKTAKLRINGTNVNILEGDIFALFEKEPLDRKGELSVIGVNDYYDDVVDNRIIAENSLHGQYINRIKKADKLDALNRTIEKDPIINCSKNWTLQKNRVTGKKVRYEIGSAVEFESYVLAAFTKFDTNNEAWLSAEEYTVFWMRFWANIDRIYAGRSINIPLMGAGITRFRNGKPSKQELLEMMLLSLKMSGFHNTYPGKSINFIIYSGDVDDIDFYHIQHNPIFKR